MATLLIKKQILGVSGKGKVNWWRLVAKKRSDAMLPPIKLKKIYDDEGKLKLLVMKTLYEIDELEPKKYNVYFWKGKNDPFFIEHINRYVEINKNDICRFFAYRQKMGRGLRPEYTEIFG